MTETGIDLMDMKVRDLLEEYCVLINLECGYHYGIATFEDAQKVYDSYLKDCSDHPSFSADSVIPMDIDFEDIKILKLDDLEHILENLGFTKIEDG